MNILYFTALDDQDESKIGVKNKIYGQCKAMENLGHEVWLARFQGENFVVTKSGRVIKTSTIKYGNNRLRCARAFQILKEEVSTWNITMLYIRNPSLCMSAYRFLKYIHDRGMLVIMELFTYPINKERLVSVCSAIKKGEKMSAVTGFLSLLLDNLYYPFLRKVVHRLVVLLPVEKIWGIRTVYIQNGIDTELLTPKSFIKTNQKITLMGVAYLSYWHGYDRLLKGLKAYYDKPDKNNKVVEFIIIGEGEEKKELEKYVMQNELTSYVHFVGIKSGAELNSYYDLADVGVAALGVHRKNTKYVSTLKSREYFAKGLPFIDSATDLAFSDTVDKYRLHVPNDDSDINIEDVITFSAKYKFNEEARNEMRRYACTYLDWKNQMSIVLKCCEKLLRK